ncbi:MAG: PEP-CTERM sorting domain-containing protein [Burkholderiaceae bacterium]|nr:PEP-CTERM sorting domain-containing protein [Burkholderiaceae bacterium]
MTAVAVTLLALAASTAAQAGFVSYTIRNAPTINDLGGGVTEFIIDAGGEKAALGSSDIDGKKLGEIATLSITRVDDATRYATNTGARYAPYLNFWITDGAGRYAVVANEPSNGEWSSVYQAGLDQTYDITWDILKTKTLKVYETNDKSWLPSSGVGLVFADLANFVIAPPSAAELAASWPGLGTGAPRELGTNKAYGVNWVFGDTQANYVSGDDGYQVRDASVTAVPEPASLALAAVALLGLGWSRRRQA